MKKIFIFIFLLLLTACSGDDSFSSSSNGLSRSIPSNPNPNFPDDIALTLSTQKATHSLVISWSNLPSNFSATLCEFAASEQNSCAILEQASGDTSSFSLVLGATSLEELLTKTFFVLFQDSSTAFTDAFVLNITQTLVNDLIQYLKAPDAEARVEFGQSVAISADGTTLAIGSRYQNSATDDLDTNTRILSRSGAVYIFTDSDSGWAFSALLKHPSPDTGDRFGHHIALSADGLTLAVSIPRDDTEDTTSYDNDLPDSGSVAIFEKNGTQWSLTSLLKSNIRQENMRFGEGSMALSADASTLAVGHYTGIEGSTSLNRDERVEIFRQSSTTWAYSETLEPIADPDTLDQADTFGFSLAFDQDGSVLAVSAILDDSASLSDPTANSLSDSGSVYLYNRASNGDYEQVKYLKPDSPIQDQRFGNSLSLSADGDILAVGAERSNNVYLYDSMSNDWLQRYQLSVSNLKSDERFGQEVVLNDEGTSLFVGVMDDNEAVGYDGSISSSTFFNLGGVYLLELTSTEWTQKAYLKPPVIDKADHFGYSSEIDQNKDRVGNTKFNAIDISSDGKIVVIGAPGEDSDTGDINGESNNQALSSGAAYIYYF